MEDEILAIEVAKLKSGETDVIGMAARLKSYRELLLLCYINEVWHKGLTPLEKLPPEMKNQIWNETKKESEGLNKDECVELAKIVYLISQKL